MGAYCVNQTARQPGEARKALTMIRTAIFRTSLTVLAASALFACGPEPRRTLTPDDVIAESIPVDENNPVVARVNATSIRVSDVHDEFRSQNPGAQIDLPARGSEDFNRILDELIDQRLLAQEARSLGLHRDEEALRRIALANERILANIMLETAIDDAVTEEIIQRIYQEQINLIPRRDEVRARHILVETLEQAVDIKAQLDAGANFAELAVRFSRDRATRLEGGDLGYFRRDGILPAFGAVAFATPEGGVSDPFQSEFGWHILTVLDYRSEPPPSLETLRPNIVRFSMFDEVEALITRLRDNAEISRPQPAESEDANSDEVPGDAAEDDTAGSGEPG